MADVRVVDANTGSGIRGAWFDYDYHDAGDGFYSVAVPEGQFTIQVGAPNYNTTWHDLRFTQVIALTPVQTGEQSE